MTKRALKLPDGGHIDLSIPDGFGAPVFALNDALQINTKHIWQATGIILTLAAIAAWYKAIKS